MHRGFIKLWRKIKDWKYHDNPEMLSLWINLLIDANHTDKYYQGILIKRGELFTSRKSLSENTGLNESTIQRYLSKLEIEHQIEQRTNKQYRIISIVKYDDYAEAEQQTEQRLNNERTTSEQRLNTPKNYKNYKNKNICTIVPTQIDLVKEKNVNEDKVKSIPYALYQYYCDRFRFKYKSETSINDKKAMGIFRNLLKTMTHEEIENALVYYFHPESDNAEKYLEVTHSLQFFVTCIDTLKLKGNKKFGQEQQVS